MPDRPTLPEPISDQGAARFRADLAAHLNSMLLHEPAELLGVLPEPTRVALMHELSERGPAWAKLPEDWPQLPRWSLRERLAARRSARRPRRPSSCGAGGPRPTGRLTSLAVIAAAGRWLSSGWPRPCRPGRPAATQPNSTSSERSRRRAGHHGHVTGQVRTAATAVTIPDPRPVGGTLGHAAAWRGSIRAGCGRRARAPGRCQPRTAAAGHRPQAGLRGTSSLSGLCPGACFRRIAPATCANDVPVETVGDR
jgi:hypothetical protein